MFRWFRAESWMNFSLLALIFISYFAVHNSADKSDDVTFQFREYDYKETSKNVGNILIYQKKKKNNSILMKLFYLFRNFHIVSLNQPVTKVKGVSLYQELPVSVASGNAFHHRVTKKFTNLMRFFSFRFQPRIEPTCTQRSTIVLFTIIDVLICLICTRRQNADLY